MRTLNDITTGTGLTKVQLWEQAAVCPFSYGWEWESRPSRCVGVPKHNAEPSPVTIVPGMILNVRGMYLPESPVTRQVLVVGLWDETEGLWFVVPSGPYMVPAVIGELYFPGHLLENEVLQVWNAIIIKETDLIQKTWETGFPIVPNEDLARVSKLFGHLMTGVPLTEDECAEVGDPITDQNDARMQYQNVETRLWDNIREGFDD